MDGEDLHRLGVGLEPPGALLLPVLLFGGRDLLREPAAQRGRAEALGGRGAVQQLREVAQVGQSPLAVDAREDPCREILADHDRLGQLGDAALAEDPVPAVKPAVHALPLLVAGGGDPLGAPADERRQGGRPAPGTPWRAGRSRRAAAASHARRRSRTRCRRR